MRNRFISGQKKEHLLRRAAAMAALSCCGILALSGGAASISETVRESSRESLQQAIVRSAVHCYAVEGRYPESLEYLKERYGIRWDTDKYVVDYEITGSNLMPDVTVIPLYDREEP